MPKEQQRFDAGLRKVLKVSPEELKRRLAKSKENKEVATRKKQDPKAR